VWGTLPPKLLWSGSFRFIPTCVGNIFCQSALKAHKPVHPHVCGEHTSFPVTLARFAGSSPRVWGTWPGYEKGFLRTGFIPTCVGNMDMIPKTSGNAPVHPHVCGEHCRRNCYGLAHSGSSPRVWGTSRAVGLQRLALRFIPTCVGNILIADFFLDILSVHPHVCGEHSLFPVFPR